MTKTVKEKSNTSAIKSRTTKLSKKTKEELIAIILRKDKVANNQNEQILSLKKEIVQVNSIKNDLLNQVDNLETANQNLKTRCSAQLSSIENLTEDVNKYKKDNRTNYEKYTELYEKTCKSNIELSAKLRAYRNLFYITFALLATSIITNILS
jgi:chromosome segregation ATPase